jgi:flagellar export protein FliJ
MKHDPVESLLRLRQLAVDEARRQLADCLRAESDAAAAIAAIEAAIAQEMEVASNLVGDDTEVEAFGAWLRRMRPQQQAAHAAQATAETNTSEARAVLTAARAAVRAAEAVAEKHAAVAQAEAARKAQAEIDEVASRARLAGQI